MFGRKTKSKAAGKAARGVGKVAGGAGKTLLKSRAARRVTSGGGKAAGKATLRAGKVAGGAGRTLLKSRAARRTTRRVGKTALKGGVRALTPKEPATTRFLKYGFFALAGFAAGALIARLGEKEVSSSSWGSGTPSAAGGPAAAGASDPASPAAHQRPEDPHRTGAEREYSDPSSGPLIGRQHRSTIDIPEQQQEVEQRIRTRIGEDPRTMNLPHLNVEVNDGVAELRGPAPSEDVKEAAGEIAAQTEGVREVRNLLTVDPQSPIREHKAAGSDAEPDRPS